MDFQAYPLDGDGPIRPYYANMDDNGAGFEYIMDDYGNAVALNDVREEQFFFFYQ